MSDRKSRGEIISLIAGVPLAAVAATGVALADDDSSGTKAQFKYVVKSKTSGQTCANCTLFKAPAGCLVVKGKIAAGGWCTAWNKKS